MAPEVIRCEPYTEKCDVYSFGVILNELVTGEHPYIDTSYGPSKVHEVTLVRFFVPLPMFLVDLSCYVLQIAMEVADGKLRPKLRDDAARCSGLVDLICRTWDTEPSRRPSFATIASSLREIKEQLVS
jgi:serine/threonine-protein kinase TNNI3K